MARGTKRKAATPEPVTDDEKEALSSAPEVEDEEPPKAKAKAKGKATAKRAKTSSTPASTTKKAKTSKEDAPASSSATAPSSSTAAAAGPTSTTTGADGMPNNKAMPETLSYTRPVEGCIRISAWNVCGLKTSQKKGFKTYVEAEDPDILVLTETKMNNRPVDPFLTNRYPHQYWNDAIKGQGGTAILSKSPALSATYTLPPHPSPSEVSGRIVSLEFPSFWLVGTYVPNAGQGLKTLERKKTWNTAFESYIRELDAKKAVVWTGDLNVAPTAKDIKRSKENYNKSAGHTEVEISAFNQTLSPSPTIGGEGSQRFVDSWRETHPNDAHYTYFSYRFDCRTKGIGWRLDYFILSERLMEKAKASEIRHEAYGASDHLPVVLDLEVALS